ncbi:6310_t:CDS:2 [Paraglomus brasilianum]|uniref:6310_t:CDS:1 n=1 Tax=Paraglomus brasilianum TaxID=144538 RepID=A0A9N8VXA3_9GLOM|nr:6310_t:CDS:2 [Paraglomus brasilianum]
MRTEDFLNPDEESEIEKLVDEETIIQAVQEGKQPKARQFVYGTAVDFEKSRDYICSKQLKARQFVYGTAVDFKKSRDYICSKARQFVHGTAVDFENHETTSVVNNSKPDGLFMEPPLISKNHETTSVVRPDSLFMEPPLISKNHETTRTFS